MTRLTARLSALFAALALSLTATSGLLAEDAKLMAYGKHLASECTACHNIDGVAVGSIPVLIGLPAEHIENQLKAYQKGELTNPAMVSVAQSLDDQQIKALAMYFGSLQPAEGKR